MGDRTQLPLLQSLKPWACKQGIQSKAGAIKCCKETKIAAPPNECRNIPLNNTNHLVYALKIYRSCFIILGATELVSHVTSFVTRWAWAKHYDPMYLSCRRSSDFQR